MATIKRPLRRRDKPLIANVDAGNGKKHHFFAPSLGTWRVDIDPARLIDSLKREGLPFNLWYVPVSLEANYEIKMYTPQVEGAIYLVSYLDDRK